MVTNKHFFFFNDMYINFMNVENKNKYISNWLLLITLLVALIIIIGGLTRLTGSGLSITKWDLFIGVFPPFSSYDWEISFNLYKQIPEYHLINSSITLSEFKVIYWWEYIHRLLGRLIGLFYFFPLLYFTYKKIFKKKTLLLLYVIFVLMVIQGFVGWYMVKSGLSERVDVSHYRLSLHLTLAFVIFISLFWSYLISTKKNCLMRSIKLPMNLPLIFIFLILLQISMGALVSGLNAGQIYQTWPLMNQNFFPDDSLFSDLFSLTSFESASIVQFFHRNIAYFITCYFIIMLFIIFKNNNFIHLRKIAMSVFFVLLLQIFLGILTILSGAQIILASIHQIGSIFLVATSLILVFKNSKIS